MCSHAVLVRNQQEKREHILPLLLGEKGRREREDEKTEKQSEVETFYW